MQSKQKKRILMIGPGRDVMGGISSVVNLYYTMKLDQQVALRYIATMVDGNKLKKLWVAVKAYIQFFFCVGQFDVVHVHMAAQASFTRKSFFIEKAHRAGKKIIIHSHAADFDEYYFTQSSDHQRRKIKKIFALADAVIVLSTAWADFFGESICEKDKIIVLRNCVMPPKYEKTDYKDRNVLFFGRLGKRKGIYDLLDAIPQVIEAVPDAMFYLGGDGDVEKCKEIAQRSGYAEHTHFLGWVTGEEKEKYFKKCSILILPSYHEGLPMAVLEAMSYGLAVITTDVGGISDVIADKANGILIRPGNVEGIAKELIRLLKDEKQRMLMGKSAAAHIIESFDITSYMKQLTSIYDNMEVSAQ